MQNKIAGISNSPKDLYTILSAIFESNISKIKDPDMTGLNGYSHQLTSALKVELVNSSLTLTVTLDMNCSVLGESPVLFLLQTALANFLL